jgi:HlyD family secretion protein
MSETQSRSETRSETQPGMNLEPLLDTEDDDIDISLLAQPKLHPRRRRRWIIPLVALLVLIVLVGGSVFAYMRLNRPPTVQYTQATASIGNLAVTISATGPIEPKAEYDLNFSASGPISAIDVHVGEQVKAGQLLATVTSTSLQDALAQAQQALSSAETTYTDAYNSGAPQTQLDQDNNAILSAQDQVKAAQDAFNATKLTAPANATVASINGVVGQSAGSSGSSSSSSSGSSPFITLIDTSQLNIPAQVNEADIASVKVGQPAQFTVEAYPTQTFNASVSTIETVGITTSNVVTYTVILTVDNHSLNGANLYPGMTATVNITTAEGIGVLLVPSAALSFSTTAIQNGELSRAALRSLFSSGSLSSSSATSASNRGVVLELKNGKLVPVVVTTGLSNGTYTEILSGLSSGANVVVSQTGGTTTTTSGSGTGAPGTRGGGLFRFGSGG